ncbi:MAG: cell division protein ZapA [Lachnospiraceae bacterium]|nr:cell division protein ZapA [Lachnospiraceae bacterium]
MADKNDIPVVINGRIYNLSGYENTDYLQEVANYMNSKIAECKAAEGFRRLSAEYQNILLAINIADDYFKVKNETGKLFAQDDEKDKQIYNLRHEVIETQIKYESSMRLVDEYKEQVNALQRKIIQMEAERSRQE